MFNHIFISIFQDNILLLKMPSTSRPINFPISNLNCLIFQVFHDLLSTENGQLKFSLLSTSTRLALIMIFGAFLFATILLSIVASKAMLQFQISFNKITKSIPTKQTGIFLSLRTRNKTKPLQNQTFLPAD